MLQKFYSDYSKRVAPLTDLTKSDRTFEWTDACEAAFQGVKQELTTHHYCVCQCLIGHLRWLQMPRLWRMVLSYYRTSTLRLLKVGSSIKPRLIIECLRRPDAILSDAPALLSRTRFWDFRRRFITAEINLTDRIVLFACHFLPYTIKSSLLRRSEGRRGE